MDFLKKKANPINGKEFVLKDHFASKDFVLTDKGQPFVRHDPLLRVAKVVLGIKGKNVQVNQTPDKGNEWSATVTVTYKFGDDSTFSCAGDCRKSTSKDGFDSYTTAMAETRASARALRFALGVDICSAEEIANIDSMGSQDQDELAEENQLAILKSKYMNQYGFKLEEIQEISGVEYLEELTRHGAVELFKELNKRKNRKGRRS